jgi:antitoxin (DNA-binding transcriptional repressor) of toxin-antitoxin stability system
LDDLTNLASLLRDLQGFGYTSAATVLAMSKGRCLISFVSQTKLRRRLSSDIVMLTVNMLEAKSSLSRLVDEVESGREQEVIIARGGRRAARLVPLAEQAPVARRLGVAKGKFALPASIDAHNEDVAALFLGVPK